MFSKKSLVRYATGFAAVCVGAVPCLSHAQETSVTLPDTGVNVSGYLTAALTSIGGTIGICVGAALALWGISFAIRWWKSKAK